MHRPSIGMMLAYALGGMGSVAAPPLAPASRPSGEVKGVWANEQRRYRNTRHYGSDGVPRGYPGAKLARKAMQGKVGRAVLR